MGRRRYPPLFGFPPPPKPTPIPLLRPAFPPLQPAPTRRVFVSYHEPDSHYYEAFSALFDDTWGFVTDRSLRQLYGDADSEPEYVMRQIREKHITGTSCTIVLCGARTWQRKFVDWEICATLSKGHGVIGINLPTNPRTPNGLFLVPDRLHDNIQSGYALWHHWDELEQIPSSLISWIEAARARPGRLIVNPRALMSRNRSA